MISSITKQSIEGNSHMHQPVTRLVILKLKGTGNPSSILKLLFGVFSYLQKLHILTSFFIFVTKSFTFTLHFRLHSETANMPITVHFILMFEFQIFHMSTVGSYRADQTPPSQIEFVPQGHTLCFLSNVCAYLRTNKGSITVRSPFHFYQQLFDMLASLLFQFTLYFPLNLLTPSSRL